MVRNYVRRDVDTLSECLTNNLLGAGVQTSYVHSSISMLVRAYVCVCMCGCVHVCAYLCVRVGEYVRANVCVRVCAWVVSEFVCERVNMRVCVVRASTHV